MSARDECCRDGEFLQPSSCLEAGLSTDFRVLIVKDPGVDEEFIQPLIETGGVTVVSSIEDAEEHLRRDQADVVILAVTPAQVPDFLERLGSGRPGLPIVVLTGTYAEATEAAAGPAEYLSRSSLSAASLSRAIHHVTERYRFHAAEEALGRVRRRLDSARRVQQHLFPKPLNQHEMDMWGIVQARDVSGDFYEFLELADGRLLVAVGDVTGHGLDAALLMATARAYLRAVVSLNPIVGAAEVLRILNGLLLEDVGDERFVALSLGLLDWRTGSLNYAAAGQPAAYVQGSGPDCRTVKTPPAIPLGIEPDSCYQEVLMQLSPGDRLVMVTDGLLEATSPAGEPFGEEGLLRCLREQKGSARDTVGGLQRALERFTESKQQRDDITLVVVRLPSQAPSSGGA